jgi:hypothetical protein
MFVFSIYFSTDNNHNPARPYEFNHGYNTTPILSRSNVFDNGYYSTSSILSGYELNNDYHALISTGANELNHNYNTNVST